MVIGALRPVLSVPATLPCLSQQQAGFSSGVQGLANGIR
jgi:hypothetical protein